jgi:3-methyladenine DNA glycosylase AlkD
MKRYMRDKFEFLGIKTPLRHNIEKEFLRAARKAETVDWDFIDKCWAANEREFQYLALDYLNVVKQLLTVADIPRLKILVETKSWWDTIDGLDKIIGSIALRFPDVNKILLAWSEDENFWLRRVAIDHQRDRKDKTDEALLAKIIENNLRQTEFFINKAIGWALREYRKTNPDFVYNFVEAHKEGMAPLSIREATRSTRGKRKETK